MFIWQCELCGHENEYSGNKDCDEECGITEICQNCEELIWDPEVREIN